MSISFKGKLRKRAMEQSKKTYFGTREVAEFFVSEDVPQVAVQYVDGGHEIIHADEWALRTEEPVKDLQMFRIERGANVQREILSVLRARNVRLEDLSEILKRVALSVGDDIERAMEFATGQKYETRRVDDVYRVIEEGQAALEASKPSEETEGESETEEAGAEEGAVTGGSDEEADKEAGADEESAGEKADEAAGKKE